MILRRVREHVSQHDWFAVAVDLVIVRLDQAMIPSAVARLNAAALGDDFTRHIADLDQKLAGFDRFSRLAREHRLFLEARGRT